MGEGYFQYAEHYFRIVSAINQQAQQNQPTGYQNGQPRRQANGEEQPPTDEQEFGSPEEQLSSEQRENHDENRESREIPIVAAAPEA
jgi:hypothetical protein